MGWIVKKKRVVAVASILGVVGLASGALYAVTSSSDNPWPEDRPVVGESKDRYPSETANDWVSFADHVVVVTPTAETETPPAKTDLERREGLIGREVTLRVDDVLWSRKDAEKPAPTSYTRSSSGWVFDEEPSNRHEFALEDQSRIEIGHSYVIALHWEGQRCAPGDEPEPAKWVGLGGGSTLPFDDGILGKGEVEGAERPAPTPRAAQSAAIVDEALKEVLAGHGASDITDSLNAAVPDQATAAEFEARAKNAAEAC